MLKRFLRQISIFLSILIFRKIKFNEKKHNSVGNFVKKKISDNFIKNPRLLTHQRFSNEIINIIQSNKLKKFLRNSVLQNIIFIHNRFFIFFELRELKKDKNWKIWKKLIVENDVGEPIRYFLYSKSSGNRIRQVYIIKKFLDSLKKKISLRNIKNVIEIGGGYGCMTDIFKKINKSISYTIYDMFEANLLQFYFLKMNNHNPVIGKNSKNISLISDLDLLYKCAQNQKKYLLLANWSLSEFPMKLRKKFLKLIVKSEYTIISFQENFENINNFNFFNKTLRKLKTKFSIKIQSYDYYNNSILNNNKHYILTLVRNEKDR